MALTKTALVDHMLKMQHDIEQLIEYGEATANVTCPLSAQLALLAMEDKTLRHGLYLKEEWKQGASGCPVSKGEGAGND